MAKTQLDAVREVICKRCRPLHLHVGPRTTCDGVTIVCAWCDHTARQVLEAMKQQETK